MAKENYDVIVVGTGAGGGMAIKTLCEAGLKVLALNPGKRTNPAKDFRNHRQRYETKYRGFGDPRELHYNCETEYTPGLWEHDITYTNAPGTGWIWNRVKVTGGKCNFWGRSSARFAEIDFKAATLDGAGVDWPITYEEIAPFYTRVERYIGVASTVQNRPSNPDGEYLPPVPFRCADFILQKGAEKLGLPYVPDRSAQLTVAHNGHPKCHYCGNCTSGCDTGSFFSPTWFTIVDGEKTGKLELRVDAVVREVLVDENGHAKGVAYVDRNTKQEVEVYSRAVVLAASCLETAHIMLNSKSRHWPTGIANSSGQLGRNLCDHLYGTPARGYLPQLLGQPSRADNISEATISWIPRWQNLKHPHEEKFIRGYALYPYAGCVEFPWYHSEIEGFGADFKRQIKRHYPTPVSFLIQAPTLPSETNYVDIDPETEDVFGIPALRFHFEWGPNELLMWEHGKQTCSDLLKASGGEVWGVGDHPLHMGFSLHETGPCRFGNDPKKFVTNKWGQCHEVPNLYIGDASIFPFCTDKTTTPSILAFTMRGCEHMITNLNKEGHA
jgi:choline dehydrogenase-like flavoprotein